MAAELLLVDTMVNIAPIYGDDYRDIGDDTTWLLPNILGIVTIRGIPINQPIILME